MIGFVGLSHLGIVSSVATAARKFSVIAHHPDPVLCDELNHGRLPIFEPGLVELLQANWSRILFTADAKELRRCELIYLSLDIPTDDAGRADVSLLDQLLDRAVQNAPT